MITIVRRRAGEGHPVLKRSRRSGPESVAVSHFRAQIRLWRLSGGRARGGRVFGIIREAPIHLHSGAVQVLQHVLCLCDRLWLAKNILGSVKVKVQQSIPTGFH